MGSTYIVIKKTKNKTLTIRKVTPNFFQKCIVLFSKGENFVTHNAKKHCSEIKKKKYILLKSNK